MHVSIDTPPEGFSEVARKLLAAAEELGLSPRVVETHSDGLFGYGFLVPQEVAEAAGMSPREPGDEEPEPEPESKAESEAPAKRGPGRPRKTDAETAVKEESGE